MRNLYFGLRLFVVMMLGSSQLAAQGPSAGVNDEPLRENWAPSEWGAEDKIGAANRITPAVVLRAVGLVKQGKVVTLGKVYAQDTPAFGGRSWRMMIPGLPTGGPFGPQQLVYNDEYVAADLGQIGTQFDGPGHIGVQTSQGKFFYNGRFLEDENITAYGLGPLGVEFVAEKGFVCRGIVLDAVALRGGRLPIPESNDAGDPGIVTDADVRAMLERQGLDRINPGDCVFLYTGHGDLWHPSDWENFDAAEKARRVAAFNAGTPGFGISACEYLAERRISLNGSDSLSIEAVLRNFTGENPQPFECHIRLQTKRGIWGMENLDLSKLIADKVYEFLFVYAPLKIKGATGSPGNPVAIY